MAEGLVFEPIETAVRDLGISVVEHYPYAFIGVHTKALIARVDLFNQHLASSVSPVQFGGLSVSYRSILTASSYYESTVSQPIGEY